VLSSASVRASTKRRRRFGKFALEKAISNKTKEKLITGTIPYLMQLFKNPKDKFVSYDLMQQGSYIGLIVPWSDNSSEVSSQAHQAEATYARLSTVNNSLRSHQTPQSNFIKTQKSTRLISETIPSSRRPHDNQSTPRLVALQSKRQLSHRRMRGTPQSRHLCERWR
jgi:hypothetical protein